MRRFSSAHLLSVLALFVALGGTALAVEEHSVGTKQLKGSAVTESKLASQAVTKGKIATDAVTGGKVQESTLGQVPSAAFADSAGTADTATSATTSASATTASTANTAGNSALFAGRGLAGVRPFAAAAAGGSNTSLDPIAYVDTMSVAVDIPEGGADLIGNASFTVSNTAGAARQAQCSMHTDSGAMDYGFTTIVPAGASSAVALTGFANGVPAPPQGSPQHVAVRCQGSGVNGDVKFSGGDVNVLRVPVG
jgi:hypothetical protein